MNIPNRITIARIVITILIICILLFPADALGINSMKLFINESIVIDIKYLISGVLFVIAALTDILDGHIAKKYNMITDLGKLLDSVADKFLISSILIILSAQGIIHPIIPVLIISMNFLVDTIKIMIANKRHIVSTTKSDKLKSIFMLTGIALTLFSNLPFELINIQVSDVLLIVATVLSIYSGIQYYHINKNIVLE